MDRRAVDPAGTPLLLRDTADAKWRLLEAILGFRNRIEQDAQFRAEIVLLGENFDPKTRRAAYALAAAYGVKIHHAQPLGVGEQEVGPSRAAHTPELHQTSLSCSPPPRNNTGKSYQITAETKLVQDFFSATPSSTRRAFDQHGRMRWSARARRDFTYVRQFGRFMRDFAFWRARLSAADSVRLSKGEGRIQFRLHTQQDYLNFIAAIKELQHTAWTGEPAREGEDPDS